MIDTGIAQEGAGGVTNVASPADPGTYMQPPVSGSRYVEVDVPPENAVSWWKGRLCDHRGPNSLWAEYGKALSEMLPARNIKWLLSKL
jgi:hypothetical protein